MTWWNGPSPDRRRLERVFLPTQPLGAGRDRAVRTLVGVFGRGRRGRRARLLGQRGDREGTARGVLEDVAGLLRRAGVELDQHVDDDLVGVVLVEADVGEE